MWCFFLHIFHIWHRSIWLWSHLLGAHLFSQNRLYNVNKRTRYINYRIKPIYRNENLVKVVVFSRSYRCFRGDTSYFCCSAKICIIPIKEESSMNNRRLAKFHFLTATLISSFIKEQIKISKFAYFVVTYSAGSKHERFQCLPWPKRCRLLPPAPANASQLLSVLHF